MPKQYHQHVSWSWFHSFFALSKKCWVCPQHGGRIKGHNSVVCMTHKCDARPHIILSSIFSIPKSLHFEYLFKIFNSRRPGWLKNQLCIFSACKLFLLDRRVPLQNSCVLHSPLNQIELQYLPRVALHHLKQLSATVSALADYPAMSLYLSVDK